MTGDATAFAELQSATTNSRRNWGDVTNELAAISRLEDDWDGMGAVSPSREVVENCRLLMRVCRGQHIPPPNLVRPTPDGNAAFEWYSGDARLEMEVSANSVEIIKFEASGSPT
jgi:hypothetical protein